MTARSRMALAAAAVAVAVLSLSLALAPTARADDGWRWPVQGRVLTPYANDNARPYAGGMHRGIDIAAPVGTAVVAARAGAVTFAGQLGSSGLTVAVRTADGHHVTTYLHLSRVSVARGASVDAGSEIGAVGTTGRRSAEEPHLHFGVRLADREAFYVDPLELLPPLPRAEGTAPPPAPAAIAPAQGRAVPRPVRVPSRGAVRRHALGPVRQPHGARPATRPVALRRTTPMRRAGAPSSAVGTRVRKAPHGAVPAGPPVVRHRPAHSKGAPASAAPRRQAGDGGADRDWGRLAVLAGAALVLLAVAGARLGTVRRRRGPHEAPPAQAPQLAAATSRGYGPTIPDSRRRRVRQRGSDHASGPTSHTASGASGYVRRAS